MVKRVLGLVKKITLWFASNVLWEILRGKLLEVSIALLTAASATWKFYQSTLSEKMTDVSISSILDVSGIFLVFFIVALIAIAIIVWIINNWIIVAIREKKRQKKVIEKLKRNDLAYQINLDIQEFRNILGLIKILQSEPKKQKSKLHRMDNILKNIKDTYSQAELVFEYPKLIDEKIRDLDRLFQGYRTSVHMLITKEYVGINTEFNIKKNLWGAPGDKDTLESRIMTVINELISLLDREYKDEQV